MALFADETLADKAPDIQGNERGLFGLAVKRIGSDQLSRRKICELLGVVASRWPHLREAIAEAGLVI